MYVHGTGAASRGISYVNLGEENAINYLSGKTPTLEIALPSEIKESLKELREYLTTRDALARDEARWGTAKKSFTDAAQAARNIGCPRVAECLAVGGQMVATAQAMKAASAASAGGFEIAAAVGAAVLLVSLFAGMDSGGGEALQELQYKMKEYFIRLSAQLQQLQMTIEHNHKETLHQFGGVRREIDIVRGRIVSLGSMTQAEIQEVRSALAIGLDRMSLEIASLGREMSYSLEEARLDKLRSIENELSHWGERGGRSDEWLTKKAAYLERWLECPPCNKLLTGELFAGTIKQKEYLAKATNAGRVGVFAKRLGITDPLINLDTFRSVFPSYVEMRKIIRAKRIIYDTGDMLWREKVKKPVEICLQIHKKLKESSVSRNGDGGRFIAALACEYNTYRTTGTDAVQALLKEKGDNLRNRLEKELLEEKIRIFHEMQAPCHPDTHGNHNIGGWFIPNFADAIHRRLPQQREEALRFASLDMSPFDLFDVTKTSVNLKGRFAKLLPIRDDVYLYPTYLPLEVLPVTDAIKVALEGEKLGLGRLSVEARLVGRAEGRHGVWFYVSNHPCGDIYSPPDPFWIYMSWSFIDTAGKTIELQQNRFSLNFFGCEHSSARMQNNNTKSHVFGAWCWNGDSISTSVFCRWLNSRFDIGDSNLSKEFAAVEEAAGPVRAYSTFHYFPPKKGGVGNVNLLKTQVKEQIAQLRKECLFNVASGHAVQKERLKNAIENIEQISAVANAWKKYWYGESTPLRERIFLSESHLLQDRVLTTTFENTITTVSNPAYVVYETECEQLLNHIDQKHAEIMAIVPAPLLPATTAPDPRVDDLTHRLEQMTLQFNAMAAENKARGERIDELLAALTGKL